jgi:3alpha(or 20beta)-hydroxysteroid dehydrogenase
MNRLAGKIVLITGGARGMGAITARLFAAEGARVVIADVLDNEGEALAQALGSSAFFYHHDVADESSWVKTAAATLRRFEKIDALVNNAGISLFKTIVDTEKKDIERVLGVNLIGTFLGLKTVGPHMIERKTGSIINISSIDGMKGANGLGAYAASKWGIRGLTKVAALEFAHHGVRVNSVHPGWIQTAMTIAPGVTDEQIKKMAVNIPQQRIGQPEDVAAASLFLASDESCYMCGAELVVDGGMIAGQYYPGMPGSPHSSS